MGHVVALRELGVLDHITDIVEGVILGQVPQPVLDHDAELGRVENAVGVQDDLSLIAVGVGHDRLGPVPTPRSRWGPRPGPAMALPNRSTRLVVVPEPATTPSEAGNRHGIRSDPEPEGC